MRHALIATVKALQDVEALEERLQMVKWTIGPSALRSRAKSARRTQIVSRTAGLLRGRVPDGLTYQRRLRHGRVGRQAP